MVAPLAPIQGYPVVNHCPNLTKDLQGSEVKLNLRSVYLVIVNERKNELYFVGIISIDLFKSNNFKVLY